jgi:hypothetical protein
VYALYDLLDHAAERIYQNLKGRCGVNTINKLHHGNAASVFDFKSIAAPIGPASEPVIYPPGYRMKPGGLFYSSADDDGGGSGGALRLSGAFEVLANTRDEAGDGWGLLLQGKDKDCRVHRWAMPRRMLAAEASAVWATLMDGGLFVASGAGARNKFSDFLSRVDADGRALAADRAGWHGSRFVLGQLRYGRFTHSLWINSELSTSWQLPEMRGENFSVSQGAWLRDIR